MLPIPMPMPVPVLVPVPVKPLTFCGNSSFLETLTKQLQNDKSYHCLIIGPTMGGKTSMCQSVFDALCFNVISVKTGIVDVKETVKTLEAHRDHTTMDTFFYGNCKPKVIFLDDVDSSLQSHLIDYFKSPKYQMANIRVVMTISLSEERSFADLKRKVEVLRIHNPSPSQAYEYLSSKYESIISLTSLTLDLCEESFGNIGSILHCLETPESDANLMIDKTVYDVTKMLLQGSLETNEMTTDTLMSYDPNLLSMMYYDNLVTKPIDLSRRLAEYHVIEESGLHEVADELRCFDLVVDSNNRRNRRNQNKHSAFLPAEIAFTKIKARTAMRVILEKRVHHLINDELQVDEDCREILFDLISDKILEKGRECVSLEIFDLTKDYLYRVGQVDKPMLVKFFGPSRARPRATNV